MAEEETNQPVPDEIEGTEAPEPEAEVVEKPLGAQETTQVVKEETGFQRGLRMVFRYAAAVIIVFGLGMLFTYFMFQRPRVQELTDQVQSLQSENDDLVSQVGALETEVGDLRVLGEENAVLNEDLAQTEMHVRLLAVLADVRAAQVSLAQEDGEQALSQLAGVPEGLEALSDVLPAERRADVDPIQNRVALAIGGIETDLFAARSDLEVAVNSLIQLENNLFVTP